jgi:hypothetical protein
MLPMAAIAAGSYELSVGFAQYIDLYADDQITLIVDAQEKDVTLTVDGEGSYYDWYLDDGIRQYRPEMNGAYKMKFEAGSIYEITLVSDTGLEDQMLYVSLAAPKVGSEDNPAELKMGDTMIGGVKHNFVFTSAPGISDKPRRPEEFGTFSLGICYVGEYAWKDRMYLTPITLSEVNKGVIKQNPGY